MGVERRPGWPKQGRHRIRQWVPVSSRWSARRGLQPFRLVGQLGGGRHSLSPKNLTDDRFKETGLLLPACFNAEVGE